MEIRLIVLAVLASLPVSIAGCGKSPNSGPTVLTTSNGVSVTLPAGAVAVVNPDHDIAFDAELVAGRTFQVTIDPFPAAGAGLFADVADYGRITEERVVVTTETFTNPQGFDVELRQFRGAEGDFNVLAALASHSSAAVLLSLEAPTVVLDGAAANELKAGFRSVCESLDQR